MRKHAHLPAMVGFVGKHVAQHFDANRPRTGPAISAKLLDANVRPAERFSEHLCAAGAALGECRLGLSGRAMRAIELRWNLQVGSSKPDPLTADIVHVREDCRNGADVAGRFGCPGVSGQMLDKELVEALVSGKDPGGGPAEISVDLGLTGSHGSLLEVMILRTLRQRKTAPWVYIPVVTSPLRSRWLVRGFECSRLHTTISGVFGS